MDYVVIVLLQIRHMIAASRSLSVGLAVVFGMMRVINLAHGEFVMIGGYVAISAYKLGIDIWFAMSWCAGHGRRFGRWSSGW